MQRTLMAALALTMILALAACSTLTEPAANDTTGTVALEKQEVEESGEGSGGTVQPSDEPQEEEEEDAGRRRGRGNTKD